MSDISAREKIGYRIRRKVGDAWQYAREFGDAYDWIDAVCDAEIFPLHDWAETALSKTRHMHGAKIVCVYLRRRPSFRA